MSSEFQALSRRQLPTNVVARRLGNSERTVRWYAKTGRIRAERVGKKLWKFLDSDVERFKALCCAGSQAQW
jgi:excisionase family DNA binding protein